MSIEWNQNKNGYFVTFDGLPLTSTRWREAGCVSAPVGARSVMLPGETYYFEEYEHAEKAERDFMAQTLGKRPPSVGGGTCPKTEKKCEHGCLLGDACFLIMENRDADQT